MPRAQCTGTHGKTPTSMTIRELYHTFADFFPKVGFFAGSSLLIINFAGRISEAALGAAGGAHRPVLHVKEPTGVRSARACTRGKIYSIQFNSHIRRRLDCSQQVHYFEVAEILHTRDGLIALDQIRKSKRGCKLNF